ncbi:MAG TPA: hypothetical protein VM598_05845 [Bdellovibrionota bacterium]|nr:hypothetical protein [Bdellovibrionota bacterium]
MLTNLVKTLPLLLAALWLGELRADPGKAEALERLRTFEASFENYADTIDWTRFAEIRRQVTELKEVISPPRPRAYWVTGTINKTSFEFQVRDAYELYLRCLTIRMPTAILTQTTVSVDGQKPTVDHFMTSDAFYRQFTGQQACDGIAHQAASQQKLPGSADSKYLLYIEADERRVFLKGSNLAELDQACERARGEFRSRSRGMSASVNFRWSGISHSPSQGMPALSSSEVCQFALAGFAEAINPWRNRFGVDRQRVQIAIRELEAFVSGLAEIRPVDARNFIAGIGDLEGSLADSLKTTQRTHVVTGKVGDGAYKFYVTDSLDFYRQCLGLRGIRKQWTSIVVDYETRGLGDSGTRGDDASDEESCDYLSYLAGKMGLPPPVGGITVHVHLDPNTKTARKGFEFRADDLPGVEAACLRAGASVRSLFSSVQYYANSRLGFQGVSGNYQSGNLEGGSSRLSVACKRIADDIAHDRKQDHES